jgi:hypothetical protein
MDYWTNPCTMVIVGHSNATLLIFKMEFVDAKFSWHELNSFNQNMIISLIQWKFHLHYR